MSSEIIARLEKVALQLESVASSLGSQGARGASSGGSDEKVDPRVEAYDDYYKAFVQPFVDAVAAIEGATHIKEGTEKAFKHLRTTIQAVAACKKPSDQDFLKFVDPIVQEVTKSQKPPAKSPVPNHNKAFEEGIASMNWLFTTTVDGTVTGALEAAEFWLNKVLTACKELADQEKDRHRKFVSTFKQMLSELAVYCKANHKGGVFWNPKGADLKTWSPTSGGGAAAPAKSGPPPPPMINIPIPVEQPSSSSSSAPGGMAAVFSQLNQGGAITSGLKKVTNDMKTKNMKDAPTLAPKEPAAAPATKAPKEEKKQQGPPKLELRQGTWFVENYVESATIEGVEMKQNVFMSNCKNATINVPGKVKSVSIAGCEKINVYVGNVVSSLELVNCKKCNIWVSERVPTIALDKTSGVIIHFNEDSVKEFPLIYTSMATEINVQVPGKTKDDDPIEMALAEQFVHSLKDGKVHSEVVKHSG